VVRLGGWDRVEQELDVAADGGEQVVEVVRNAPGMLGRVERAAGAPRARSLSFAG
jgi:hypothetical protein